MSVSKKQAGYTKQGTKAEHCSICTHFEPPDDCKIVTGEVEPWGWCSYFKKKTRDSSHLRHSN